MSDDWPWSEAEAEDLRYLWDGSDPDWVVLETEPGRCIPYNVKGAVQLIEASGLNKFVCQRMKEAGCKVLTELPTQTEATVFDE